MVITIDTGYQNRPSWLWQTTSFITGSHAQCFMTGLRSRRRRWPFFFCLSAQHPQSNRPIRGVQYCNRVCIWMFLVRYIVTGCIFRAPSAIWQGQVLTPPPPPPAAPPYPVEKSSAPPPPRAKRLQFNTFYFINVYRAFPKGLQLSKFLSHHVIRAKYAVEMAYTRVIMMISYKCGLVCSSKLSIQFKECLLLVCQ